MKNMKPINFTYIKTPIENNNTPRSIGIMDGKATFKIKGNGKISI